MTRYGLLEAAKAIVKGAHGHTFFPSPPELRIQCDRAMEWHREERARIHRREQIESERIPRRPEPTADEKRRVQEVYRRFLASYEGENKEAAERAEVRARYGMDEATLAGIKDRQEA